MPAKRRTIKARLSSSASEDQWRVMLDEVRPGQVEGFAGYVLEYHQGSGGALAVPALEDHWASHGTDIVAEWVQTKPGTRPSCWWKWNSPRWTDKNALMGEPRTQVGGSGSPCHEIGTTDPRFRYLTHHCGIPVKWRSAGACQTLGLPEYDPDDPPLFESQATYLARHDLFLPGERRRVPQCAFEPVLLTAEFDAAGRKIWTG